MRRLRPVTLASLILVLPLAAVNAQTSQDDLAVCDNAADVTTALTTCLTAAEDKARPASDRALAYADAGLNKFAAHEPGPALNYFQLALKLDANSDVAYAARASVEFATGDYDVAIRDAEQAVALKPKGHPEAYVLLGTLADRDGNHEARIAYMSRAIALAPNFAEAYAGRGNGYYFEQKYDLALADFRKATDLNPDLVGILRPKFELVYTERGGLSMRSGDYNAAIDDYSKELALNSRNVRALNDRGDAFNMTGEFDRAIADLSRAINIDPSVRFAYVNRGVAYFNAGKNDQALADLDTGVSLGDRAASTYFVRGLVQQRTGNRQDALADFQKALDLTPADDPDRPRIQAAIVSLNN